MGANVARLNDPTTVGSKTPVGRDIREAVAAVLLRFPSRTIEEAADLTDEGVRLLKNSRRTISTETLIKLARAKGELGPAMWGLISELCGRHSPRAEHESPRLNALFGALAFIAKGKGPEAQFAAALVAVMNADGADEPPGESAAVYDLFDRRRA